MTSFFGDIPRLVAERVPLTGLSGGALAFALRVLVRGPTWVIVPSAEEAENLRAELAFTLGEDRAWLFADDDVRPYDGLSPQPAVARARVAALAALGEGRNAAVVAPAAALLRRVLPPELLAGGPWIDVGVRIEPRDLAAKLGDMGYLAVGIVEDPGSFRHRGEVLDIWPTGLPHPLRLEWFDDQIEAMRELNPSTQRSGERAPGLRVLPAREEVLGEAAVRRARAFLRGEADDLGRHARRRRGVVEDFQAGIRFSGCSDYLPALHPLVAPLDYATSGLRVVLDRAACLAALEEREREIRSRFDALSEDDRPLVGPAQRFVASGDVGLALRRALRVEPPGRPMAAGERWADFACRENPPAKPEELAGTLGRLLARVEDGWRVGVVVHGTTRAERLRQLLHPHGVRPRDFVERNPDRWPPGEVLLLRGDLPRGFVHEEERLAVLSADEILGVKLRQRQPGRAQSHVATDASIASFSEMKEGDLVVHDRHGIGRFLGLKRVDLGHGVEDMVLLEYRGNDRMYLPVHKLDHLSRYRAMGGAGEQRLDRLGGETWTLRKAKVKGGVLELAHQLVTLAAERQANPGNAYVGRSERFTRFEESFPYTETADQAAAIEAVLADLAAPRPMDRLIVGDAGFGKTEVAMRAAFRVAEEGRQVVMLVPTTVLAVQHFRNFRERFEPFGVKVGLLSRFTDDADQRRYLAELRSGALQVVIGTTRLLGRGVRFHELGLVVVDEEHRFGVKQKEQLKRLRTEVDYLAMSATPIPRSLHQAMSGIREVSVISTPPEDRLPVQTAVGEATRERIRGDILRELQRGGQAFFVHNRIESIEHAAARVREAVPEATLEIAHGEQADAQLEDTLVRFAERRFDVLVCTAIVEAGLDMPNVNTILVDQAERFGLAQLYQLRGRVGRSFQRGFCTLLVEPGMVLPEDALRRLRVLQEHTQLGAGFAVAMADLELRGTGNLLGDRQHGHIAEVGFETWLELLEEAMDEARGHAERQRIDPEVELGLPAFIPESFIDDTRERLLLYKRLSSARSVEQIRRILDEAEDLCGQLPPELVNLGRLLEIKSRCRGLGIERCAVLRVRVVLQFADSTVVEPARLAELARSMPRRFSVKNDSLEVRFTPEEGEQIFMFIHWILGLLDAKAA